MWTSKKNCGFTLVELLIVISIISLLMALILPALAAAKDQARSAVCKNNIRQIVLANIGYAHENDDYFVIAAYKIIDLFDFAHCNLQRWHGARDDLNCPFDPLRSPLVPYLAGGAVKECPQNVPFRHGDPWQWDYEDGCGGYGYNLTYLGSRLGTGEPFDRACLQSARSTDLRKPSQTLMFADTAMAKRQHGMPYYLEYSFAEPPFFLDHQGLPVNGFYASPSIHFRHRDCANIGWADGHVDSRPMAPFDQKNVYGVKSADMMLGWPEPLDNSLFDLK